MYYVIHMHIRTVYMLYTCCIHAVYMLYTCCIHAVYMLYTFVILIMTLENPGLPSHDANARSALRAADSCEHRWSLSTAGRSSAGAGPANWCHSWSFQRPARPCMVQRWENLITKKVMQKRQFLKSDPSTNSRKKEKGVERLKSIENASFVWKGFHFLENRTVSTEMSLLRWWTHLLGRCKWFSIWYKSSITIPSFGNRYHRSHRFWPIQSL